MATDVSDRGVGYAYTPLHSFRPSRRVTLAIVTCALALTFVTIRNRGCQCDCKGKQACETWSCERPLAHALHDQWPSWPPVAKDGIPRDNLPSLQAEDRWRALHQSQVAAAEAAHSTVVAFLGDSITEGWLRSGFSGRAPSVAQPKCEAHWKRAFDQWHPLNLAIGGDRAQDLGWRLQHGLLPSALRPKVFFVMIGTNDLGAGERWDVAASEVQLVLEQLHARRPDAHVIVHGLLPRGSDEGAPRTPSFHRSPWWLAAQNNHYESITKVNAKLNAFATRHREWLSYLDCSHLFLASTVEPADQLVKVGSSADASDGSSARRMYIPPHLMYDLLHLTPEAYALWAGCLRPKIGAAIGGAAPSLTVAPPASSGRRPRALEDTPRCIGRSCRGNDVDLA